MTAFGRTVKGLTAKRHYLYVLGIVVSSSILAFNGLGDRRTSAQAANSIYLTPASGTFAAGSNFTVSVMVNTADPVNAAEAKMTYSSNLEFVSIDGNGSAFGIDASSAGGSGSVVISRATITPVSGDKLLSRVTFKAVSAGQADIVMLNDSQALSASTNSDVITSRSGGNYTIPGPAVTPVTPASPTPPANPPATPGAVKKTSNQSSTTIAPTNSSQTTTALPGDSIVELKTPVTVETKPDAGKIVTKVEYSLNGKVVSTDTTAPYSHSVDSTKMRNGTYVLVTKTYYQDGKTDTSNASLVVKNPFGLSQLLLQLRHFAWLIIIVLIVIGELVYLKFFRHRNKFNGPSGGPIGSGYGPKVVVGEGASSPSAFRPSAVIAPAAAVPPQPAPVVSAAPAVPLSTYPVPTAATQPQSVLAGPVLPAQPVPAVTPAVPTVPSVPEPESKPLPFTQPPSPPAGSQL